MRQEIGPDPHSGVLYPHGEWSLGSGSERNRTPCYDLRTSAGSFR